jgi:hypothetical protein
MLSLQASIEEEEFSVSELLASGGDMAGPMLIRPLLSILKDEDSIKEFAKHLLYMRRLSDKMGSIHNSLYVVKAILDKDNPLQLAGVTFDDLEVFKDDRPGDSRD